MSSNLLDLCTLPEAILLSASTAPACIRNLLVKHMLPLWNHAIEDMGEGMTKVVMIGGKYKRLPALSVEKAMMVVEGLKDTALAGVRKEILELHQALISMENLKRETFLVEDNEECIEL